MQEYSLSLVTSGFVETQKLNSVAFPISISLTFSFFRMVFYSLVSRIFLIFPISVVLLSSLGLAVTISTSSPTTTSTLGIGDFVAQEIGLAGPTSGLPSWTNSSASLQRSVTSVIVNSSSVASATLTESSTSIKSSGSPVMLNSSIMTSAPLTNLTETLTPPSNQTYPTITATGKESLYSCNTQWGTWDRLSSSWLSSVVGVYTSTFSETLTSTYLETFKLCDGVPRANVTGTVSYSKSTYWVVWTNPTITTTTAQKTYDIQYPASPIVLSERVYTTTGSHVRLSDYYHNGGFTPTTSFGAPTPACSIGPSDCMSLYQSYSQQRSAYPPIPSESLMQHPICSPPRYNFSAPCTLYVTSVDVL